MNIFKHFVKHFYLLDNYLSKLIYYKEEFTFLAFLIQNRDHFYSVVFNLYYLQLNSVPSFQLRAVTSIACLSDFSKKKPFPFNGTFVLFFTSLPAYKMYSLCVDASLCNCSREADAHTRARDWLVAV